jgi:hypothetical protein
MFADDVGRAFGGGLHIALCVAQSRTRERLAVKCAYLGRFLGQRIIHSVSYLTR